MGGGGGGGQRVLDEAHGRLRVGGGGGGQKVLDEAFYTGIC